MDDPGHGYKNVWVVGSYGANAYKPGYMLMTEDGLRWFGDAHNKATHFPSEAIALEMIKELRERPRSFRGRFFVKRIVVLA